MALDLLLANVEPKPRKLSAAFPFLVARSGFLGAAFGFLGERNPFLIAEFDFLVPELVSRPAKPFSECREGFSQSENPFAQCRNRFSDRRNPLAESERRFPVRKANSAARKGFRSLRKPFRSPRKSNSAHLTPSPLDAFRSPRPVLGRPSSTREVGASEILFLPAIPVRVRLRRRA